MTGRAYRKLYHLFLFFSFWVLCGFQGCFDEQIGTPVQGILADDNHLTGYVDTRVGTGGIPWVSGGTTPAVSYPHGLVKVGPDTRTLGRIMGTSGYYYGDEEVVGFSHTRLSGTGAWEGGALRVIPSNKPGSPTRLLKNRNYFSHYSEIAVPGFYRVDISKKGIRAELTSTPRVGLHRYTFQKTDQPHLIIDLTSHLHFKGGKVIKVKVTVDPTQHRIQGSFLLLDEFSMRYGGLLHFFVAETHFSTFRFFTDQTESTGSTFEIDGGNAWLDLGFSSPPAQPIELKVALSNVSVEGAANNLAVELPSGVKSFDQVREENTTQWHERLSRIRITGSDALKRLFYSNLYRAFTMPTIFSDEPLPGEGTGRYFGFDKKIRLTGDYEYYSDISLWDTFRTVHPLYNLIAPKTQLAIIDSLLRIAEQGDGLPLWPCGGGHADAMLGLPANIVIGESILKGLDVPDVERAYRIMRQAAVRLTGRGADCLAEYMRLGFCPSDIWGSSVTFTLEYSYADRTMARLAQKLNKPEDAAYFERRSRNYLNLWNPSQRLFAPKTSRGNFEPISASDLSYIGITQASKHYVEGGPTHWRWYLFNDAERMIAADPSHFVSDLDTFFTKAPQGLGVWYPGSGYWHGNEHDIHAAYLFNAAGRPDLTQKLVRWILTHKYKFNSVGLDGNDDAGTLSTWYVFSSLGFYPVAGSTRYMIGSPVIEEAELKLGEKTLKITARNFGTSRPYVKSAFINQTPLPNPWFEHDQIRNGGELVLEMSETPSSWISQ